MANAPLNTLLGQCHWSMTKLKQWWRAYCVLAYYQHDEQKLSTVEFRKLYRLGFRQVFVL